MGVGFAKDGEGAVRNNRNLLTNQRNKYFRKQDDKSKIKKSLKYRDATVEELDEIRSKLSKQKMRDKRITIIVLLVSLFLTAYIIFW